MSTPREQPLRVSHLISPGQMAGAEKVVLAGCQALIAAGADVELAVIREMRFPAYAEAFIAEAQERGIPYFEGLKTERRVDLQLHRSLSAYLRTGMDVIHAHGYKALLYARLARAAGLPWAYTHHGDTGQVVQLYQWLVYRTIKRVDAVCAVSPAMKEQLKSYVPAGQLHLVENMLAFAVEDSALQQSDQNHDGATVELVAVGRLSVEKGLDVLISAIAELAEPRLHLTIVGNGPEEEALQSLVAECDLADRVTFAGFQKDVQPFLRRADAFVMPSFCEGLPLSLIEAAAVGLPVVGTNVGGIPSIVKDGVNGCLCAPRDAAAFRLSLARFLENANALKDAARHEAIEIRQRYSADAWAKKMLAIYEGICGTRMV